MATTVQTMVLLLMLPRPTLPELAVVAALLLALITAAGDRE